MNVTDPAHQRELMAAESPGPKYNVSTLAANGGRSTTPRFSFAPQSPPGSRANLPNVDTPTGRGQRESWLSVINRDGVLVMPTSSTLAKPDVVSYLQSDLPPSCGESRGKRNGGGSNSPTGRDNQIGSVFGAEHRFGMRQDRVKTPQRAPAAQRVQFVSTQHTRENMGEFSPGPIYAPHTPECPGGRLAPSPTPSSGRRPRPPGSPADVKNPHASLSSRSSWLAGNVHKSDGLETLMMQVGDVPPGPGSYRDPKSSFATFSHNSKAQSRAPVPRSPVRLSCTAPSCELSSSGGC